MERISEAAAPVTMRIGIALDERLQSRSAAVAEAALGERGLHGPLGGFAGDPDDERAGTQRLGDQQSAVQDEMRGTVDQHRVLAAGRFVLTAVDDDDRADTAFDRGLGDRAQLLVEGEARAAAALQVDVLGELREGLPPRGSSGPMHLEVHGQIESFDKVEARRELRKADHADFWDVGQGLVHL